MSNVSVRHLIQTNQQLAGSGTGDDPLRRIYSLWTLDGKLVLAFDPHTRQATFGSGLESEDAYEVTRKAVQK